LGDGTTTHRSYPTHAINFEPSRDDISLIIATNEHTVIIKNDNTIHGTGSNPLVKNDVAYLSAGSSHYLALKTDGTVYAWGENSRGQLGLGTNQYNTQNFAWPVPDLTDVVQIKALYDHSLALKSDGTVWAWGDNSLGSIGDGTMESRNIPVQVEGLAEIVEISAGSHHSIALKKDGTLWAWG
jgi:alpha-tubulin suppressor-like RCC1 family protein